MVVTQLRIGEFWKELEQTFQMHIITFLSLKYEPRYLRSKLTLVSILFIKNFLALGKL